VDVAGQRGERKKWIHCVMFVVNLASYDSVMEEEEDVGYNRLRESIKMFDDLVNSRWFCSTHVLIFFNNGKENFSQKLETHPLSECFPDYSGSSSYEECFKYVKKQFLAHNYSDNRTVYNHEGECTDAKNVEVIFECVCDIMVSRDLRAITVKT
jgi:hypothetical protein